MGIRQVRDKKVCIFKNTQRQKSTEKSDSCPEEVVALQPSLRRRPRSSHPAATFFPARWRYYPNPRASLRTNALSIERLWGLVSPHLVDNRTPAPGDSFSVASVARTAPLKFGARVPPPWGPILKTLAVSAMDILGPPFRTASAPEDLHELQWSRTGALAKDRPRWETGGSRLSGARRPWERGKLGRRMTGDRRGDSCAGNGPRRTFAVVATATSALATAQ
ncbi:hypothetical protein HPB47_008945 [Ixodes persulcatus]|uniref:Uncharacterized protein n=1 Tax=Ixodes persulcatus TaxID=34615 RepID=A0AC60P3B4_IXOPE|nr:hypothetical protein HPB47_008945 [Ixodes persulcatus]